MVKRPFITRFGVTAACVAAALVAQAPPAAASDPFWGSSGAWGQDHPDQWGLARIGWTPELARTARSDVVVAVIDTGIDFHHPDLAPASIWRNPDEVVNGRDDDGNGYVDDVMGWNFVDGNPNPWDLAGHGTHVAGVIAAATGNGEGIAGIAPSARIMPLKVLNFLGRGRSSGIAAAIAYAATEGARVINLSLGGEELSSTEKRAIEFAARQGVLVVAAAGNAGGDVAKFGPAGLPSVLCVGASGLDDRRASFSNAGAEIDLVAPGEEILSLRARGTDVAFVAGLAGYTPGSRFVGPEARYYRVGGTSFAAPFVSGAAALLLARDPALDARALRRVLEQSARDVGPPGVDGDTGYGLLDLAAAAAADPRFFVEARIDGVAPVQEGGATVVRVSGVLDADAFESGVVEIGAGEEPSAWTEVKKTTSAVRSGAIADIPAASLAGSKTWTVRAVARHAKGRTREHRYRLEIGG